MSDVPRLFSNLQTKHPVVKNYHGQDSLQKKVFNWASSSRGLASVMAEQVSEQGQRIALISTHKHKVERTSLK